MEAAVLIRTRSLPAFPDQASSPSVMPPISRSTSFHYTPPRAVHLEVKSGDRRQAHALRRARSDAATTFGQQPREEALKSGGSSGGGRFLSVGVSDRGSAEVLQEEAEFSGGGAGKGRKVGGGGRRGGSGDGRGQSSEMGAYYKELLRVDPENPLLLMNYGKYLHQVEGDLAGAEECYGRAILASPSDADALSLYGKLMWEAHGDEERAEGYFQRAVEAAPDDCYVLGSYAHFLWDAEEEGETTSSSAANPVMVEAF